MPEAVELCKRIYNFSEGCGCYPALTGGTLYKDGPRKDLDLVFYRIRQCPGIDKKFLFERLASIGITVVKGFGWIHKAHDELGRTVDLFFPEEDRVHSERQVENGINSESHWEEDPDPDPRPACEVAQAIVMGQCAQGMPDLPNNGM